MQRFYKKGLGLQPHLTRLKSRPLKIYAFGVLLHILRDTSQAMLVGLKSQPLKSL